MINNTKIEICVGTIDDVVIASKFDIDRIELNCAIELGGITPSIATLKEVKKITNIPIMCMVRNRGAGFNYSDVSKEVMLKEAKDLLDNGADGIVFGFLNNDKTIDEVYTEKMCDLIKSYNKEIVFHKAFDACKNTDESIKILINLGVDRILTDGATGGDICKGISTLKYLNDTYGDKIEILPGGGVKKDNILKILKETGINQIHMTSKKTYKDLSDYYGTDEEALKEILELLNNK